jgi:uncharacterized protein involved in exopolysaccharide biosynthesis
VICVDNRDISFLQGEFAMSHSSSERKSRQPTARVLITILLVCLVLLGATAIAFVWLTIRPKHVVSGAVRIAPTVENPVNLDPRPFDRDAYAAFVRAQAAILSSTSLLSKVADDLAGRGLKFFSPAKIPVSTELGVPERILKRAIANGVIQIAPVPDATLLEITMVSENEEEAKTIVDSLLMNCVAMWRTQAIAERNANLTVLENERNEVLARMADTETQLRDLAAKYGPTDVVYLTSVELSRQGAWSDEIARVQQRRMSLEAARELTIEEGIGVLNPYDLLSCRQRYLNADPLVQALAHRIAEVYVDLAVAGEKEPNDTATMQRQQRLLDTLGRRLAELRQARQRQFEQDLSDAIEKQRQRHSDEAKIELQRLGAYEERLDRALAQREANLSHIRAPNPLLRDLQSRLKLDQELYEKVSRRIREMEVGMSSPPSVSLAYQADFRDTVDTRWQWSLIALGATFLFSVILLIARHGLRPRPS